MSGFSETDRSDSVVISQFEIAMSAAGLIVPGGVIAGGSNFNRFDAPGDKKGRHNGFYLLRTGKWPMGWYGDWKLGLEVTWRYDDPDRLSPFDRAEQKRALAKLQAELAAAKAIRHAEVAEKASRLWDAASADPVALAAHPYVVQKRINPRGLRLHIAGDNTVLIAVPMYAFNADGMPVIHSLQLIGPNGDKRFLRAGRVESCFFAIAGDPVTALICEGVATAATCREATGFTAIAAFNAGNLAAVAESVALHRPDTTLIIAADDDRHVPSDWVQRGSGRPWVNAGRTKGLAAARAVKSRLIVPKFSNITSNGTDFNDLAVEEGIGEVRRQFLDAATTAKDEPHVPHAGADESEDTIALAFTAAHRNDMRYDHDIGKWYQWDGDRWKVDGKQRAFHYARELGRQLGDSKRAMCKAAVAAGAERFARADPSHATTADCWDRDPMLLGTPGGTIDLRSGCIRPPDPSEFITRLTSCKPEEGTPTLWEKFLYEATGCDPDLVRFLQRWCGYCLTGDTREQALLFVYGPGGTGKSVFLNTLSRILAEYSTTASMDTFTAARNERHSTELAMLNGSRMVAASETEEGRAWAEARIKALTGGELITARFMRQDFFTFQPQCKFTIASNHAPLLHNVDDAMRRRLNFAPFITKPAVPDLQLEEKLKEEDGKILAWMISGCLDWQRDGLARPASVTKATNDYFEDQDVFGQWVMERCERGAGRSAKTAQLFADWSRYARDAGHEPGTSISFSTGLKRLGFTAAKTNGHRIYRGLSLRSDGDAAY